MEYFGDGDLLSFIKKNSLTHDEKLQACAKMSAGLFHMHDNGVIHADIALR